MKSSDTLEIKSVKGNIIVRYEHIIFIRAERKHSIFFLSTKDKIESINNLGYHENKLPRPCFFRSHKTLIVNCRYVEGISHSSYHILLKDSTQVKISRYRKRSFINNLHYYNTYEENRSLINI